MALNHRLNMNTEPKNDTTPWTLPPPPAGREWMQSERWTRSDLPENHRPLLIGECAQKGDEYQVGLDEWEPCQHDGNIAMSNNKSGRSYVWLLTRTTRPLPAQAPEEQCCGCVGHTHICGKGRLPAPEELRKAKAAFLSLGADVMKAHDEALARVESLTRERDEARAALEGARDSLRIYADDVRALEHMKSRAESAEARVVALEGELREKVNLIAFAGVREIGYKKEIEGLKKQLAMTPPQIDLDRLNERYERDSVGYIDHFIFSVSVSQNGEERVLKGREQDLLATLHNAFPAISKELAELREEVQAAKKWNEHVDAQCREARAQLATSQESERRMREALGNLLFAIENADETGYVTDVGFLDLDAIQTSARALLTTPVEAEGAVQCDGRTFKSPLDAALHLLWLLQRLSFYEPEREGMPCDGFRFREGIKEARKLLATLDYEKTAFEVEEPTAPPAEQTGGANE